MSASSLTSGNFALQTALLSAIKACGASCGAVISFWDPNGATLSSVEFTESNSNKFQHTIVTAPLKNNVENVVSSFESTTKISDIPSANPISLQRTASNNISKIEIRDECTLSEQHHLNANNSNDQSQTILPMPQVLLANNNNNNSSSLPSKSPDVSLGLPCDDNKVNLLVDHSHDNYHNLVSSASAISNPSMQPQPQSQAVTTTLIAASIPSTSRVFSHSYRCVAIASTATVAATSSPQNPKNIFRSTNHAAKYNHLAHVFAGDGEAEKGKHQHQHQHQQALQSQIRFYNAAHNVLANKAVTPAVVEAVAKSGMAVHCTSPSSPYLAVPVMARKSQIDLIYSASSRRLLEGAGPAGSLNHLVVVGVLVLVGFPVVDENAAANSVAVLEGGGSKREASLNDGNANNLSKREVRMMLNSQTSIAAEKENAFNALSSKKVSFRAEEETVAVTLARTVFAEILSTPEGMLSVEKSMGNYLVNSVSMLQRPSENNINNTKNTLSSPSPNAGKTSNFRRLAGAAKLVVKLGSTVNNSTDNENNNKNNNNNNSHSSNNHQGIITEMDDFHRSTIQRRIPQIIRIPDTTIFLSHRGILSQKTDEFQALPDLPEVKKTIEEAEQALAMLREQNMSLQNIMNTTASATSNYNHNNNGNFHEGGISSLLPSSSATASANVRMMTVQEGMEKLEKKIAALRRENISLRNHVELLTHRLDSVTSRKSIQSVAMSQILGALDVESSSAALTGKSMKRHHGNRNNEDDDGNDDVDARDNKNYRLHSREDGEGNVPSGGFLRKATWGDTLLLAARDNGKHGNRPSSSSSSPAFVAPSQYYCQSSNIVPKPPTSASHSSRSKNTDDNNNFIFKAAHDVLSRPLPPSVLLEAKAVEGLDKLKMELANKGGGGGGTSSRGSSAQAKNWKK